MDLLFVTTFAAVAPIDIAVPVSFIAALSAGGNTIIPGNYRFSINYRS